MNDLNRRRSINALGYAKLLQEDAALLERRRARIARGSTEFIGM
jgi:hypothetical protein